MTQVKVSVIVPVYKVEGFLKRCVESLLGQTLRGIEIILVDDGSPDRCPQMCDEYAKKDSRIKVVHKKNAGLGMACNSGLDVAIGEYVAFCDSDDWVDKDMYETLYQMATEHGADAVFSGIMTTNEKGESRLMSSYPSTEVIRAQSGIHSFLLNMIASEASCKEERKVPMSAKVVLYKHSIIKQHQLRFMSEREYVSEDLLWNMDVLCHSKCVVTSPRTFYHYYNNTNSLSKSIRKDKFPYFKVMREELIKRGRNYCLKKDYLQRVDRMFIGYSRYYIGQIMLSSFPLSEKYQIVSAICKDVIWKKVWDRYPTHSMPLHHRLFSVLMKHRLYAIMYVVFRIKKHA